MNEQKQKQEWKERTSTMAVHSFDQRQVERNNCGKTLFRSRSLCPLSFVSILLVAVAVAGSSLIPTVTCLSLSAPYPVKPKATKVTSPSLFNGIGSHTLVTAILHPPSRNLLVLRSVEDDNTKSVEDASDSDAPTTASSETVQNQNDDSDDDQEDQMKMEKKIKGRKKRLIGGYKVGSTFYLLSSFVLLALTSTTLPISTTKKITYRLAYVFSAGHYTMSSILSILQNAASHDRLSSDTYKRLNIVTIFYGFISLVVSIKCLPPILFNQSRLSPSILQTLVWKVPALVALINGCKGYGYGVWGWEKKPSSGSNLRSDVGSDFLNGLKTIIPTVFRRNQPPKDKKDMIYAVGTAWIGGWTLLQSLNFFARLISPTSTLTPYQIYDGWTGVARFGLLSTMLYTLSDASARGRLSGSTFVQLGYDLSLALLTLSASIIITPKLGQVRIYHAVPLALYSIFLAFNSWTSGRATAMKKNKKE